MSIKKSRKLIQSATTIFDKTLAKIVKANEVLEKGIKRSKKKYEDTDVEIYELTLKLGDINQHIIEQEDEIKANLTLFDKLQDLVKR